MRSSLITRVCRRCGLASADLSLYLKAKNCPSGRDNLCKPCANVRTRETQARLKALVDVLKDRPCDDCGVAYAPHIMDWDHRPSEVKVMGVSRMRVSGSEARVRAEIAKCDLVCANCHRQRTQERNLVGSL